MHPQLSAKPRGEDRDSRQQLARLRKVDSPLTQIDRLLCLRAQDECFVDISINGQRPPHKPPANTVIISHVAARAHNSSYGAESRPGTRLQYDSPAVSPLPLERRPGRCKLDCAAVHPAFQSRAKLETRDTIYTSHLNFPPRASGFDFRPAVVCVTTLRT